MGLDDLPRICPIDSPVPSKPSKRVPMPNISWPLVPNETLVPNERIEGSYSDMLETPCRAVIQVPSTFEVSGLRNPTLNLNLEPEASKIGVSGPYKLALIHGFGWPWQFLR